MNRSCDGARLELHAMDVTHIDDPKLTTRHNHQMKDSELQNHPLQAISIEIHMAELRRAQSSIGT